MIQTIIKISITSMLYGWMKIVSSRNRLLVRSVQNKEGNNDREQGKIGKRKRMSYRQIVQSGS